MFIEKVIDFDLFELVGQGSSANINYLQDLLIRGCVTRIHVQD